jgi:protein arginine kinase activator
MTCELCGKEGARIRIRQIIGSESRELNLCERCAKEKGIIENENSLEDNAAWFLHGLFEANPEKSTSLRFCPVCGTRLRDIKSSRRVGCGACYETFSREIRKILKISENEKNHQGKLPKRVLAYKLFFIDRENLKIRLETALNNEEYEKAAELRDKILELDAAAARQGGRESLSAGSAPEGHGGVKAPPDGGSILSGDSSGGVYD